jgi:hypothetical protein
MALSGRHNTHCRMEGVDRRTAVIVGGKAQQ